MPAIQLLPLAYAGNGGQPGVINQLKHVEADNDVWTFNMYNAVMAQHGLPRETDLEGNIQTSSQTGHQIFYYTGETNGVRSYVHTYWIDGQVYHQALLLEDWQLDELEIGAENQDPIYLQIAETI